MPDYATKFVRLISESRTIPVKNRQGARQMVLANSYFVLSYKKISKIFLARVNAMESLKSKVTSKGQIVIPKQIRARYGIKPSSVIHWIEKGEGVLMVPDSEDSILAARGMIQKAVGF